MFNFGAYAFCIDLTSDGGYIVAGTTVPNVGNYLVIKLDGSGDIQWQKKYGGSDYDVAYSIQQTTDGGYIVGGWTLSNDGDVTGNHGTFDYWVVKLDDTGKLQWEHCYGGSSSDCAYSVQQTSDGGYIVAGFSYSMDGEVIGSLGQGDCWLLKLDTVGNYSMAGKFGGNRRFGFMCSANTRQRFCCHGYRREKQQRNFGKSRRK